MKNLKFGQEINKKQ